MSSDDPIPSLPRCVTERAIAPAIDDGSQLVLDAAGELLGTCLRAGLGFVGADARRWRGRSADLVSSTRAASGALVLAPAAWQLFASGAAGAVAVPSRTASLFGLQRAQLDPSANGRNRFLDLIAARRMRRRWRRATASLAADLARTSARVDARVAWARSPGDDGTPFDQLPTYARAARAQALLREDPGWHAIVATWFVGTPDQQSQGDVLLGTVLDAALDVIRSLPDSGVANADRLAVVLSAARGAH